MQVTKEGIEQIKAANELGAIVAERGIAVKKKGKSLVASCPFHEEKTPSFTITPSKGLFHCFGCGASGDVIGFVSRYDGVGFPEALELLAKRAGLSLPRVMKERPRAPRKTKPAPKSPPPSSFSLGSSSTTTRRFASEKTPRSISAGAGSRTPSSSSTSRSATPTARC